MLVYDGETIKWCNHYRKQYGRFLKKLKTELPNDLAVPFLCIMSKRTESSVSKIYLYTHVYSSIIHNNQEEEAAPMSTQQMNG